MPSASPVLSLSDIEAELRRHVMQLCVSPRTPQSGGYFRAQEYLKSTLRQMKYEPLGQSFYPLGLGECTNIYAETQPESSSPRILIGAHYETRDCSGVGADDNASAVAVVLELARLLSKSESSIPYTFVFFDMEENYRWGSLRGSKAFSDFYSKPIDRVIILDLVGGSLAPHFERTFLQFGEGLPALSHPHLEFLHLPLAILEPYGSYGARSDYDAFRKKGTPFTFISIGNPWYYHTENDRPDVLDFKKMSGLVEALKWAMESPKPGHQPDWETVHIFLEKFWNTPELRGDLLEKLLSSPKKPSRLQIMRLYKHIIPRLRKYGLKLWLAK